MTHIALLALVLLVSTPALAHAETCSHGMTCPPDDAWYAVIGRTGRCQAMSTDTNTPELFIQKLREEGDDTVEWRTATRKDGRVMGVIVQTKDTPKFRGFSALFMRGLTMCQDFAQALHKGAALP